MLVLLTSLQNIVIFSVIVTVRAGVKSTNVVCPHNRTYDFCVLAIFLKTGFVDIVPLCCKLIIASHLRRGETVIIIVWGILSDEAKLNLFKLVELMLKVNSHVFLLTYCYINQVHESTKYNRPRA